MGRLGHAWDLQGVAVYLARKPRFMTGQTLYVGRRFIVALFATAATLPARGSPPNHLADSTRWLTHPPRPLHPGRDPELEATHEQTSTKALVPRCFTPPTSLPLKRHPRHDAPAARVRDRHALAGSPPTEPVLAALFHEAPIARKAVLLEPPTRPRRAPPGQLYLKATPSLSRGLGAWTARPGERGLFVVPGKQRDLFCRRGRPNDLVTKSSLPVPERAKPVPGDLDPWDVLSSAALILARSRTIR